MKVFIDAEFTNLNVYAKLISMGFISQTGEDLYVEFRGWDVVDCNKFVVETVLPLLDGSNPLLFVEACPHIAEWLLAFAEDITLIADSQYDWHFFQNIFHERAQYVGQNCIDIYHLNQQIRVSFEWANFIEPPYNAIAGHAMQSHFLATGRQHHALEDARALRKAWLDVERAKTL